VHFAGHGTLTALWVVYIRVVKAQLGLDDRARGFGLFALPAGAVVAMQAVGPLVRRTGTGTANRLATVILAAALVPPAYATGLATLAAALLAFGAGLGLLDVVMNAQAAEVETGYQRPIMAAFHAAWSLSAMAGASVGGLLIRSGWPLSRTATVGAVLVGAGTLLASRWLLPTAVPPGTHPPGSGPTGSGPTGSGPTGSGSTGSGSTGSGSTGSGSTGSGSTGSGSTGSGSTGSSSTGSGPTGSGSTGSGSTGS